MRHNRDDKRFSRTIGHLRCMMANLTNDLIVYGRLRTTTPKAKELRRHAERMITLGRKGDLSARRRAMAFMRNKQAVTTLFSSVGPRFRERNGGYTRILKVGIRPGDCTPMSLIELVEGAAATAAITAGGKGVQAAGKPAPKQGRRAAKAFSSTGKAKAPGKEKKEGPANKGKTAGAEKKGKKEKTKKSPEKG